MPGMEWPRLNLQKVKLAITGKVKLKKQTGVLAKHHPGSLSYTFDDRYLCLPSYVFLIHCLKILYTGVYRGLTPVVTLPSFKKI